LPSNTQKVFEILLDKYGPQYWWPGEPWLEIMIGAVLVQSTAWKNVELAVERLRDAKVLDPKRLLAFGDKQFEDLIRSAGYFRRKAKRLRSLMELVWSEYEGSKAAMQAVDTLALRKQLLAVHGIDPETADAILLYALDQPAFVVDTYMHRIFARHGWVLGKADYYQLQEHLVHELPVDVKVYNELHALLVQVGKSHCRKTPICGGCPLQEMLPKNGIVEACR